MDMGGTFDLVLKCLRIMIGILMLITFMSISSGEVVIDVTGDCAAGASEETFMWFAYLFTLWCIFNAVFFVIYGTHLGKDRNLMADALPSKFSYLMLGFACSFTMLAFMATFANFFFTLEVRYMKFHCQPRAFRYTLPSIAISVIVGCGAIIYQAWQTPHK